MEFQNGQAVTIAGRINNIHDDGTAYVTLDATGQSVYTDLRNCKAVEAEEEAKPAAKKGAKVEASG